MIPILALLDIGPFELLLMAAVAVMFFGGDLPDVARKAARMVARLRAMSTDLTQELQRPPEELRRPSELNFDVQDRELLSPPRLLDPPGPKRSGTPTAETGGATEQVPQDHAPPSWRPENQPPDPERFPGGDRAPALPERKSAPPAASVEPDEPDEPGKPANT